jgi:hypothetical protein
MAKIEELELDSHRKQLNSDVEALVEKYRSIFEWDVPDIDQRHADRLIVAAIRKSLDGVDDTLARSLAVRQDQSLDAKLQDPGAHETW